MCWKNKKNFLSICKEIVNSFSQARPECYFSFHSPKTYLLRFIWALQWSDISRFKISPLWNNFSDMKVNLARWYGIIVLSKNNWGLSFLPFNLHFWSSSTVRPEKIKVSVAYYSLEALAALCPPRQEHLADMIHYSHHPFSFPLKICWRLFLFKEQITKT